MIGGFLGAGKTTAMARLAGHYMRQGNRVALVTNDQAHGLVDTHTLRSLGFDVGEVAGACFCCKFQDLLDSADCLAAEKEIDILLAEPVGSCTDLVAPVLEPLRQIHGDRYDVGPLTVLLKPEHGQRILRGQTGVGFSPKAAYIFLKQLEEADLVVVNKADKLSQLEREELFDLVTARFPGKRVLTAALRDGLGFEPFVAALETPSTARQEPLQIDYDIYAEGEAELGWLNATAVLTGKKTLLPLQAVAEGMVEQIRIALAAESLEPIHLKILADGEGDFSVANLVSSAAATELSRPSENKTRRCELTINARVAADPAVLSRIVRDSLSRTATRFAADCELTDLEHFRPARPVPTHRIGPSATR